MNKPNAYTLITGASTGIGRELARVFAEKGHSLILIARSEDKLNALKIELEEKYAVKVEIIVKDLSRPAAAKELYIQVLQNHWEIEILINNAGVGVYGYFKNTDLTKELEMLQLNMVFLTELTKLFLPSMLQRRSGKILNTASTAAFQPGPVMACYFASKAYVLHFSEALDNELKGTGVSVSVLCPGPTESNFQKQADLNMNMDLLKVAGIMSSLKVAKAAYQGLMHKKRIIIPGFMNWLGAISPRLAPRAWVTAIVHRLQKP